MEQLIWDVNPIDLNYVVSSNWGQSVNEIGVMFRSTSQLLHTSSKYLGTKTKQQYVEISEGKEGN